MRSLRVAQINFFQLLAIALARELRITLMQKAKPSVVRSIVWRVKTAGLLSLLLIAAQDRNAAGLA